MEMTAAFEAEYGVEPALERMPAVEAVAMMLPDDVGLEEEVFLIAGAACFAARNTLEQMSEPRKNELQRSPMKNDVFVHSPESIDFEYFHEVIIIAVGEHRVGTNDASIGKEDIQPSICLDGFVHYSLHRGLARGVKLPCVNFDAGVLALDLLLVFMEMLVIVVTDVDGPCATLGILMCRSTTNTHWRVRPRYDGDLAGESRRIRRAGDTLDFR